MSILNNEMVFTASGRCTECNKGGRKCAEFTAFNTKSDATKLVCQQCLEDIISILSRISKRIVHVEDLD